MPRLAALVALILVAPAAPAQSPALAPIFDGQSLGGWRGWAIHDQGADPAGVVKLTPEERAARQRAWTADAAKHWRVEGGELVNDGGGAYLATEKDYGDIELTLEYRTVAGADSGVYLRSTPQVQIWDSTDPAKFNLGADKGSGGLWNNPPGAPGKDPLVKADLPFGAWNALRIVQVGERTTVDLNGKRVVEAARMHNYWDKSKPLPKSGAILLQTHGGEIRWRNIKVREIPAAEANEFLRTAAGAGFEPIFDGKSLAGFAGATDDYEVVEGAIVCKPKRGGNLFTEKSYSDFKLDFEYKLPPGGNNGVILRYPGSGDGAYVGMGEVQILDDDAPQYAGKLDARQANGSLYGVAAAHRGCLRPTGQWNFMSIAAKGSALEVELNGTRVTSTDVSKATEFMANSPHPGLTRAEGRIGFAGHSDPVAFRAVRVRAEK